MRIIFFVLALISCNLPLHAQTFKVATYNLRYDNPGDSLDLWANRLSVVAGMVQLYDFDIFGTQEGLKHQLDELKQLLPGYHYVGVGRDDGEKKGEHSAVFYKTSRYKLINQGTFWLSPQTDKPGKGWDAAFPRVCTWGLFEERESGKSFYFFNTHFDHRGEIARKESVTLILRMMENMAGNAAFILTGDFNFDENNENYALIKASGLLGDTYDKADLRFAPNGTFNNFDCSVMPVGRIDHIFVTAEFDVVRYGILTNTYNGRFPSDHFPVFAELKF